MTDALTDRDALRKDLLAAVDQMVDILAKPSDLYETGQAELVAQYGDITKVPVEASANNANMEAGYSEVPHAIAEALGTIRSIAIRHLGPTGMQMSFADVEFFAKSIEFDGPMHIVKADRFLFPQYDGKVTEWANSEQVKKWLAGQAQERLLERPLTGSRNPDVQARLEELALSTDVEILP